MLISQLLRGDTLHLLEHFRRRRGLHSHEEMDVIRLDRQFLDVPPVLGTLRLDQCPAVARDLAREDRLASLRTPDEVVDDKVDSMFVALILDVGSPPTINGIIKAVLPEINGLKPSWRNPPNHGLKPRGLRRVQSVKGNFPVGDFVRRSRAWIIGMEHRWPLRTLPAAWPYSWQRSPRLPFRISSRCSRRGPCIARGPRIVRTVHQLLPPAFDGPRKP